VSGPVRDDRAPDRFATSPQGAAYLEAQRVEREARGRPFGLSSDQVETADMLGQPLDLYAQLVGVHSIRDVSEIRAERDRLAAVELEAQRQAAIARRVSEIEADQ